MTAYIIITLLVVIVGLVVMASALSSKAKRLQDQRNRAIGERDELKRSVDALNQRINDLAAISAYQKGMEGRINEAKTDKEAHGVIDDILAGNNGRVSNHKAK